MLYDENNATGLPLSRIAFGGAGISGEGGGYGFGAISEDEARELLRFSWDQGINLYDSAPIYGFGLSEERIGKYLPREAVIISKCGVDWHSTKRVNMTNDPKVAERMLLESLKRLRRDYINIYMVHWPDKKVDIRRTLEVLQKAQQRQMIEHIGLCNTNTEELMLAAEVCDVRFVQSELNLFETTSFEQMGEHWKKCFSMGWGTFDKGILSGRVTKERLFAKEDARSWAPWWRHSQVQEKIDRTIKLQSILKDYDLSLPAFCVQYNLNYFGLSSTLIGFKNISDVVQVTSNLHSNNIRERIEEVVNRWKS